MKGSTKTKQIITVRFSFDDLDDKEEVSFEPDMTVKEATIKAIEKRSGRRPAVDDLNDIEYYKRVDRKEIQEMIDDPEVEEIHIKKVKN